MLFVILTMSLWSYASSESFTVPAHPACTDTESQQFIAELRISCLPPGHAYVDTLFKQGFES